MKKTGLKRSGTSWPSTHPAHAAALRPIAYFVMLACCDGALANPTGPAVVNGAVSFARPDSRTLSITNSPGSIINWQGFSIGAGELTRFNQQTASSAVLNRVVGGDISRIFGTLSSNGRVLLINPQGIMVGAGGVIDTAGFVGSTLNMLDRDFIAGKLKFEGGGNGTLQNAGTIKGAGDIYLVGPNIENSGLIRSENGNVVLAAGKSVTITSPQLDGVQFTLQAPTDSAINLGSIEAKNAVSMFAGTLRHSGDIRAGRMSVDASGNVVLAPSDTSPGGRVTLAAQKDVTVEAGATITARGNSGGDVTIRSGDTTLVSGSVDARGDAGPGGTVRILGERVGLVDHAHIDASGETGGGTILVGGDYQGKNADVQNASRVFVGSDTTLTADAVTSGRGGKVIVWADDINRYYGATFARGGAQSGDGGFVEVSGKRYLDFAGTVDTRAPHGAAGMLLLDPTNISIVATDTTPPNTPLVGGVFRENAASINNDSEITVATLLGALQTSDVTINTNPGSGAGAGDISFNTAFDFNGIGAARTLTLVANRNINIGNSIGDSVPDTVDRLGLVLNAGTAANITADIDLRGGLLDSATAGSKVVNMNSGTPTISNVSAFNVGTLNIGGATASLNGPTTASTLNLTGGSLQGSGNVTVTSAFSRTLGTGIFLGGSLSINQAAGPLVTNGAINADSVSLTAVNGIVADEIRATYPITLSSSDGNADVVLNGLLLASNTLGLSATTQAISVTSGRSIVVRDNVISNSSGGIALQAGGDIVYEKTGVSNTTNVLSTVGNLSLTATNGSIYRTSPTANPGFNVLNVDGAEVRYSAGTNIETMGTVTSRGLLTMTAGAAITTTSGAISASTAVAGNVNVTAGTTLTAGAVTAGNGTIALQGTGTDVILTGALQTTKTGLAANAAAIGVIAGRDVAIGNANLTANGSGGINVRAGAELRYANTAVTNTTNTLTAPGNVSLTATTGALYRTSPAANPGFNTLNVSGADVAFGAGTNIETMGTVTATGALTMTAGANLTTTVGALSASSVAAGDVTLTAGNTVTTGAVTAGNGTIALHGTSTDVIVNGSLETTKAGLAATDAAISVSAGRDIAIGNANLTANGSGGIRMDASAELRYANTAVTNTTNTLTAPGAISLTATNGALYRTGPAANPGFNTLNVTGGSVTMTAGTSMSPMGDVITATAGDLTLTAGSTLTATRLTTDAGKITLSTSNASDIFLTGALDATKLGLTDATPLISVSSARNIDIPNVNLVAHSSGGITLQAGGEIAYSNTAVSNTTNEIAAPGNVTLTATNGSIYRTSPTANPGFNFLNVSGADVAFSAAAANIETMGTVTATGALRMNAGGAISTTAGAMSAGAGDIILNAGNRITAGAMTEADGTISLASSGQDIFLAGSLQTTRAGFPVTTAAISVNAARDIEIGNANLTANNSGGIMLLAGQELRYHNAGGPNITNTIAAPGNVSLTSTNNSIYRTSPTANPGNNFLNISGQGVAFSAGLNIGTMGTVTATGALSLSAGSFIDTTAGAMTAGSIPVAGTVTLTAGSDINAGPVTATNGTIALESTGRDVFLNGSLAATKTGLAVTAPAISVLAARDLAIGNANVTANNSGGVTLQAGGELRYANTASSNTTNTVTAPGNVSLSGTRIYRTGPAANPGFNALDISGASVSFTSGSDLTNLGRTSATGNVTLSAGTTIGGGADPFGLASVGGVVNASTSGGAGDIYLSGNGALTTGALATPAGVNALSVQVTANDLTIGSSLNTNDDITLNSGGGVLFSGGVTVGARSLTLAGLTASVNSGVVTFNTPVISSAPFIVGGTLNLNGATASSAPSLDVTQTGILNINAGQFQIAGNANSSGTINLAGTGSSPTVSFGGDLLLLGTSVLGVDLHGTNVEDYGRIEIVGPHNATLNGRLNVTTSGAFNPATGNSFQIVAAPSGSVSNNFSSFSFPDYYTYQPSANANDYVLTVMAAPNVWTNGSGTGLWQTAANWRNGAVPTAGETALIPDVGTLGVADTTVTVSGTGQTAARVVSSENLTMSAGDLTLGVGSSSIASNALLTLSGGTLTANGPLSANVMTISGGTLNGTGAVTANTVNWSGTSTLSGTGALNVNTLLAMSGAGAVHAMALGRTINNSGAATLTGGELRGNPGGASFNNSGTFTITDNSGVTNNGTAIAFANSGTLTKSGGAGTSAFAAALTNSGNVNVNSGTLNLSGTSTHTTGTVTVAALDTLQLSGGTHGFDLGSTLTGAGNLTIAGATANVNGRFGVANALTVTGGTANFNPTSGAITAASLDITGGTANFTSGLTVPTINLNGNGTLTGSGPLTTDTLNWGDGTISGNGSLTVNTTLAMTTGTVHAMALGRTINNAGAATLTGGELRGNPGGASFNNSGTFTITDNSGVTNNGTAIAFANSGTLTKSGGAGTSAFAAALTNSGNVNVNSGTLNLSGTSTHTTGTVTVAALDTLQLSGGTHGFDLGSTLTGAGNLIIAGATANVNGRFGVSNALTVTGGTASFNPTSGAITPASLAITGGTANFTSGLNVPTINLSGNGTLTGTGALTADTLNWGDGTISGGGSLTVNTTLDMTTGSLHAMALGRTINNAGAATLTGGELRGNPGGASFNNTGTFTITDDSSITNNGTAIAFANSGTLTKSGGVATSTFSGALSNTATGTINAGAGTLRLNSFPSNAGTINIASGASLSTNGNNLTNTATGTIGGEGTLSTATLTNDGMLRPGSATGDTTGTLTIAGNLTQGAAGQVNVELGGTAGGDFDVLAVTGNANLAGTLNVSTAGAYTATDGHQFTVLTAAGIAGTFGTITRTFGNPIIPTYTGTNLSILLGSATLNLWNVDSDGNWDLAANWSLGHVPTAGEQVAIDRPAGLFTITVPAGTFSADLMNSNENVTIAGGALGTLTLANASTINAALAISSGRLQGAGMLTVNGPLNITGGTLASSGGVVVNGATTVSGGISQLAGALTAGAFDMNQGTLGIANNGVLNLTGAGVRSISGNATVLNNAGIVHLAGNGNLRLDNGATLNNSGTFDFQGNAGIQSTIGTLPVFSNTGILSKSGGTGASILGISRSFTFDNTGTLDAQIGTLRFNTVSAFHDGTQFTGAGANVVSFNSAFDGTITSANLELQSGAYSGTANFGGTTAWTGGTINGLFTVPSGATLDLTGINSKVISAGSLTVAPGGTLALLGGGGLILNDGAAVNAGGILEFRGDAFIDSAGGAASTLTNLAGGTLRMTAGTTSTISGASNPLNFVNNGTLDAAAGTTIEYAASNAFNSGTVFTGAGTHLVTSDSTFNGAIAASGLTLQSGSYGGTATLSGNTAWTGGTITGNLTVPNGSAIALSGADDKTVSGPSAALANAGTMTIDGDGNFVLANGGAFTNSGTATWNGGAGGIVVNGGSLLTNAASSTMTLNASVADTGITGAGIVRNEGLLQTIAAGIRTLIGTIFDNIGTVAVQAGTLRLAGSGADTGAYVVDAGAMLEVSGGTRDLNAGSSIGGPGGILVSGGALNVNTAMTLANPVQLAGAGASLGGSADVTLIGPFDWSNGAAITGGGVLTTSGATMISGIGNGIAKTWFNEGTVGMAADSALEFSGAAWTFTNRGTFDLAPSGAVPIGVASGSGLIRNEGIFNKAGAGTQTIASGFINTATGALNISADTLAIPALDSNAGLILLTNGATLTTNGVNGIVNTGTIAGNGTIDVGPLHTLINSGVVRPGTSPGTLSVTGDYMQTPGGTLAIEIGGMQAGQHDVLQVTGTANLGGTLAVDLVNGFTPQVGNTFEFMTYGQRAGDFSAIALPQGSGSSAVPNAGNYEVALFGSNAPPPPPPAPIAGPVAGIQGSDVQAFNDSAVRPLSDQFLTLRDEGARMEVETKLKETAVCR